MPPSTDVLDVLQKALLVLSRTVDEVLEKQAVRLSKDRRITSTKLQILRLLSVYGTQTSTQIARFLGVTKPAVTQIINAMESSKLVIRQPTKKDHRRVPVKLTKRGANEYRGIHRRQRTILRATLKSAKIGDVKKSAESLMKLSRALVESGSGMDEFCLQCSVHRDGSCVLLRSSKNCEFETRRIAKSSRTGKSAR